MRPSHLKDVAGFALACLVGAALATYHQGAHFDPHIVWDGFNLPGFDAHVYVAMAESPRTFTVAPWGYRILLPSLIGVSVPPRWIVPAFGWAAFASLVAASGLLFIYLRVLGSTLRAALLAVAAMMLTPSVAAVFENPFLVEPFALAWLLVALITIQAGASPWTVSLSLVLLALSKEVWLFLLPVIFLKKMNQGVRPALTETVRIATPALLVGLLLRWIWTPQAQPDSAGSADYLGALGAVITNVPAFAGHFLLGGLGLVALLALSQPSAREYGRLHAVTLLALLALPIAAAAYTGDGTSTNFFSADVPRLLIYVLPFAAALAVCLDPDHGAPRVFPRLNRLEWPALAALAMVVLAPLSLDRYSRIDLSTSRDGPYVLGFSRETLKTARRLDRGETVTFDPGERKFAWGVTPPEELAKLRFFLRDGFGPLAHYGIHDIRMREPSATLIVPLLSTHSIRVTLTLDARESAWLALSAGGKRVGEALIGPQSVRATFDIPGTTLFRGDNLIELTAEKAPTALPRILRLEIVQSAGS